MLRTLPETAQVLGRSANQIVVTGTRASIVTPERENANINTLSRDVTRYQSHLS